MSAQLRNELNVRIEESARGVLDALVKEGFKITVTVESVFYASCCGSYEEKSLKVEPVRDVGDTSDFFLIGEHIPLYINKEAFDLVKSRRNHFTIYADMSGKLYSDQ